MNDFKLRALRQSLEDIGVKTIHVKDKLDYLCSFIIIYQYNEESYATTFNIYKPFNKIKVKRLDKDIKKYVRKSKEEVNINIYPQLTIKKAKKEKSNLVQLTNFIQDQLRKYSHIKNRKYGYLGFMAEHGQTGVSNLLRKDKNPQEVLNHFKEMYGFKD